MNVQCRASPSHVFLIRIIALIHTLSQLLYDSIDAVFTGFRVLVDSLWNSLSFHFPLFFLGLIFPAIELGTQPLRDRRGSAGGVLVTFDAYSLDFLGLDPQLTSSTFPPARIASAFTERVAHNFYRCSWIFIVLSKLLACSPQVYSLSHWLDFRLTMNSYVVYKFIEKSFSLSSIPFAKFCFTPCTTVVQ